MGDMLGNALSGLVSYQRALATTSHNIANADTEGYSRQKVDFTVVLQWISCAAPNLLSRRQMPLTN